jgi:HAD superfamily hydrolase (TIGR01458 family)
MLNVQALLIDLDGTVYFKGEPIQGAAEAIGELRRRGFRLLFLTNTDSQTRQQLAQRLNAMSIAIAENEILTCVQAGLAYVKEKRGRAFCLMPKQLAAEFEALGRADEPVRYVVVGDPRQTASYAELNEAFRHVMAGAELIALQKGRFFFTPDGPNLDTGAIVALLEYASGRQAEVMGKPAAAFFRAALHQVGVDREQAAVVGDDVTSDIAGAIGMGMKSILVRTGKFGYQALSAASAQPTVIVDSLADLPRAVCLPSEGQASA